LAVADQFTSLQRGLHHLFGDTVTAAHQFHHQVNSGITGNRQRINKGHAR
jgi:hypothetical protein